MESEKEVLNWVDYERIVNEEYTDIIVSKFTLAKLLRREKTSIRLAKYQIEFLKLKYPKGKLSEAFRNAIDDLITLQKNGDNES